MTKYLIPLFFAFPTLLIHADEVVPPPKTVTLTQAELKKYVEIAIQNYIFQQNIQSAKETIDKIEGAFK